jgi:hypothetical protein
MTAIGTRSSLQMSAFVAYNQVSGYSEGSEPTFSHLFI